MTTTRRLVLAAALGAGLLSAPLASAFAGAADPLFINLTSDDAHRIDMAFAMGGNQHKRGHKLTVFMNDRAVLAASKANAGKFAAQQKQIEALIADGATILVCPMCMKHFGVKEEDLLPGLKVGSPDVTGAALFQDGTKTLSW
jgi:predicted peroxiredoxin